MTKQTINVGTYPNDKTGDKTRDAWLKANANFDELYNRALLKDDAGRASMFMAPTMSEHLVNRDYVDGRTRYLTAPTQSLNSWCDIRVPLLGGVDADNVITLQNNSKTADGKFGNAAIRVCAPAEQGGWEHCAWGFSARTNAKFMPGTSYWEVFASEPSGFYPNAAIAVTHGPGTPIMPSRSWPAITVKGDYGDIIFGKNDYGTAMIISGTTGTVTATGVLRLAPTQTATGARLEAISYTAGDNGSLGFNGATYLSRWRTDSAITLGPGAPIYDNVGVLAFGGNHTNGDVANVAYAASIAGRVEGPYASDTNMPTGLVFSTGVTGVQPGQVNVMPGTPRMWLTSTGRLGIGQRDPKALLAVAGGIVVGSTGSGTLTPPTDGALFDGYVGIGPGFGTTAPESRLHVTNGGLYVDRANTRQGNRGWAVTAESNQDKDGFVYTRVNKGAVFLSHTSAGAILGSDLLPVLFRTGITSSDPTTGDLQMKVASVAGAVNYLTVSGAATTASPSVTVEGADTNIDLALNPKGTGRVRFGAYVATALAVAGYIEIKDSSGAIRRLAVV